MIITDTYYRGYRLSTDPDVTTIWWEAELIETTTSIDHAKSLIDEWMTAP